MALKSTVSRMATESLGIESQFRATKLALEAATDTIAARDKEILSLRATVRQQEEELARASARSREEETIRYEGYVSKCAYE